MTTLGIEPPTFWSEVRRATIALQGDCYNYSNRPKVCPVVSKKDRGLYLKKEEGHLNKNGRVQKTIMFAIRLYKYNLGSFIIMSKK